ncbi:DUF1566 domain-containing protein [Desulfonatronum lacustre]|uniref:Lcl C-terminal domain-containing protein n=1 Tax=Desulfonatronum lacustre TaxID=66849 RepID=UPI000686BF7B|nr:DUF1566 domain-containing protein [Desulfonatronum lacustre]
MKKLYAVATMAFVLCLTGLVLSGTAFADRCVDNGDGTVTDNGTGLMWQKATAGPMNWDAAMSYASGLSLAGRSDWRLPGRDRLEELYHSPCKGMIELSFPAYWSSTTNANNTNNAWHVNFNNGNVNNNNKSNSSYVRAVRDAHSNTKVIRKY